MLYSFKKALRLCEPLPSFKGCGADVLLIRVDFKQVQDKEKPWQREAHQVCRESLPNNHLSHPHKQPGRMRRRVPSPRSPSVLFRLDDAGICWHSFRPPSTHCHHTCRSITPPSTTYIARQSASSTPETRSPSRTPTPTMMITDTYHYGR